MYKIYADEYLIHNDNYEKLKVDSPTLELELNQAGSLQFSIYPNHPYFEKFNSETDPERVRRMKSIIKVFQDEKLIFRGRILENENGLYTEKQVTCEGELAFFIDSQQRPYKFSGTPKEYMAFLLDRHNSQMPAEKQFVLGTVSDSIRDGDTSNDDNIINRSSESIVNTWEEISKKLIEELGGYLVVDEDEEGNRRINYLSEDDFKPGTQEIKYGENLLNLKINVKGDEIATALIPAGGKIGNSEETEERLTIEEEGDTDEPVLVAETDDDRIWRVRDYIYSETGVEKYGWIFSTQTWDDVMEDKVHLLNVAISHLNDKKKAIESVEINAVDLSKKENVSAFALGTRVKVTSKIHNLKDDEFPITKMTLNLSNPASNTLTLVKTERTFTETSISINKNQANIETDINSVYKEFQQTSGSIEKQIVQMGEEIAKINSDFQQASGSIEKQIDKISEDIITLTNHTTVLWSGELPMAAEHAITLAESISAQQKGIVLIFSKANENNQFYSFFIPKYVVASHSSAGHQFMMTGGLFEEITTKYLYITDTQITGHDNNEATGTANGITYNNAAFVLKYVVGV